MVHNQNRRKGTSITDGSTAIASLWLASPVTLGGNLPYPITDGEHVIGRNDDCQIIIRDVSISRRHAKLLLREGCLSIDDLSSTNGTFVNKKPIQSAAIETGTLLVLGNVRLFIVPAKSAEDVGAWFDDSTTYRNEDFQLDLSSLANELTPTQLAIVQLLVDGKSEVEIARGMHRSQATIHNHVQAVYRRLDVHSLADLLRFVYGKTTEINLTKRI